MKYLCTLILLWFSSGLFGQELQRLDYLYLENGSLLKGKVVEYIRGEKLVFELTNGEQVEFAAKEIDRIVQGVATPVYKEDKKGRRQMGPKVYEFQERGWYNLTYFASYGGKTGENAFIGIGLLNITGFQFNRMVGLGLGIGADAYSLEGGETLYPVFAEARGYLFKKNVSPYYAASVGYGFAFKDRNQELFKARGGLMFHPAIGLRLGGSKSANMLVDVGYKFQNAYFERRFDFNGDIEERNIKYKRFTVRFGLIF
ncbi:MAG: hypothetical protein DHS20C18_22420 [Saprospiraceae bacterium]|nr:MAG: hypothetical protein DHS20C18_22420 [Saprospiraceae bacterium]